MTDDDRLELEQAWRALEDAAAARAHRGGYGAGHRCAGCGLFIRGRDARCDTCGHLNHRAPASR